MPELTLQLHELWERHEEIPDVEDCYLVAVFNEDIPAGDAEAVREGVFPPVPFFAEGVDALSLARDQERYGWEYGFAWDEASDGRFRFGCNTPTINHPVTLTFRWGEGHPEVDGVKVLPHVPALMGRKKVPSEWCDFCRRKMNAVPEDCQGRRLRSLAKAAGEGTVEEVYAHLKAIELWHTETLTERWDKMR